MKQVNESPYRDQTSDLGGISARAISAEGNEQSNQDTKVNLIAGAHRLASHCHNDLAVGLPTSFHHAPLTASNKESNDHGR